MQGSEHKLQRVHRTYRRIQRVQRVEKGHTRHRYSTDIIYRVQRECKKHNLINVEQSIAE